MRTGSLSLLLFPLIGLIGGTLPAPSALAAEAAGSEVQTVTMVTKEYVFLPAHLTFKVGVSYQLHVVNEGKELHELTAPDFFKSIDAKNPQILANSGKEIVVQPHETKDFYFVAKKAGHFALTCADHDWAGMTGDITIE